MMCMQDLDSSHKSTQQCIKPFDQPRDAAQLEGLLGSGWKKFNYLYVVVEGQKGFAREHQNGFFMRLRIN